MKLYKLLPIVSFTGIATIAMPLISCGQENQGKAVAFSIDSQTTTETTATLTLDWTPSGDSIVFNNWSVSSDTINVASFESSGDPEDRPQKINVTFSASLNQDLDDVVVEFDYEDKTQKIVDHVKIENIHVDQFVPEVTEWNNDVEPVLCTFDGVDLIATSCDLPKAIHSKEIYENVSNFTLSFVDTASGYETEFVNKEQSYLTPNAQDNNYVDLHVTGANDCSGKMVTIKVTRISDGTEVLSQPTMLWMKDSVEIWNPNAVKTVKYDPDNGSFSASSSAAIKISLEDKETQDNWTWEGLYDLESGTTFVEGLNPAPFQYIATEDGYQYYDFEGQSDQFIGKDETMTLTLICRGQKVSGDWSEFDGYIYNIEFSPY